jgi:hypothetical protein
MNFSFSGKDFVQQALNAYDKCMCTDCRFSLAGSRLTLSDDQKKATHVQEPGQCLLDRDRLMFSMKGIGTHLNTLCGGQFYSKQSNQLELF